MAQPVGQAVLPPARRWIPWAIASGILAVTAGILAFVHFRESPQPKEIVRFLIEAPEKTTFAANPPLLSPDGQKIAFIAAGAGGRNQVWIRSLDAVDARPLSGTEGIRNGMFWSADSRSIAFDSAEDPPMVKRVDIAGGPPQSLCPPEGVISSGAWSRGGIVVIPGRDGLKWVPASGGACTPLTRADPSRGELTHRYVSFLPDGRHFLYLRPSGRPENSGIYIGSLDAKPEQQDLKRLVATDPGISAVRDGGAIFAAGYLLFRRQGTIMAQPFDAERLQLSGDAVRVAEQVGAASLAVGGFFSASMTGALAFRTGPSDEDNIVFELLTRDGKETGRAGEGGTRMDPVFSPDGAQLAYASRDNTRGNANVWLYDIGRNIGAPFTFDTSENRYPIWSYDGKRIVFSSSRDGVNNLYWKASNNTGQEEPLLKTNENKTPQDWSRDGRYLLFASNSSTTSEDLWYLPMTPEQAGSEPKPKEYLKTKFIENQAKFSPDTHFVAYTSDASGAQEVYVQTFPDPSGGQWPISRGGGYAPRWRRDGRELVYIAPGARLMSVEVTLNPVFKPGIPKELFRLPPGSGGAVYDIRPDGQKIVVANAQSAISQPPASPITVVLNWPEMLKKK